MAEPAFTGLEGLVSVRVVVTAEVLVQQLAKLGAELFLLLAAQFVELFADVGGRSSWYSWSIVLSWRIDLVEPPVTRLGLIP